MIKIFTGDDRKAAGNEIKKFLGENYEIIDCADLTPNDLPQIFKGTTLFDSHRRILLRDFTANTNIYPEIIKYLDTPHDIILLETKLDKRTTTYKDIKDQIEIKEFKLPPKTDPRAIFDIYKVAKRDSKKAVEMLKKIEPEEDPIKFTGLLVSQAIKDFQARQGIKEKQILKDLSRLDIQMKSTKIPAWTLVEAFLISISKK